MYNWIISISEKEKWQKYYSTVIKFNAGPSSVKTSLVRQRNRWESRPRGSAVLRWTQATVQIHSHTGQISVSPTSVQATEIRNSASLQELWGPSVPFPSPTGGRMRDNYGSSALLQQTHCHHLEMKQRGQHTSFAQHIASMQPKLFLGFKASIRNQQFFHKLSHSLWQRHLLKAIICLNIPHSVGRTWVMLRACCRM